MDNIGDIFDLLLEELENEITSGDRLDQIASEHISHGFGCEICECFDSDDEMIGSKIARHVNCPEKTLDKLIDWGEGRGDPGWEVDILLAACSRNNFSGKWLDYVLDTAWVYRLQFERNLHYHFISTLLNARVLTEEEKSRIMKANEMEFNGQSFPTQEELDGMRF